MITNHIRRIIRNLFVSVCERGVTEGLSVWPRGKQKVMPLTELIRCHGHTCISVPVESMAGVYGILVPCFVDSKPGQVPSPLNRVFGLLGQFDRGLLYQLPGQSWCNSQPRTDNNVNGKIPLIPVGPGFHPKNMKGCSEKFLFPPPNCCRLHTGLWVWYRFTGSLQSFTATSRSEF